MESNLSVRFYKKKFKQKRGLFNFNIFLSLKLLRLEKTARVKVLCMCAYGLCGVKSISLQNRYTNVVRSVFVFYSFSYNCQSTSTVFPFSPLMKCIRPWLRHHVPYRTAMQSFDRHRLVSQPIRYQYYRRNGRIVMQIV